MMGIRWWASFKKDLEISFLKESCLPESLPWMRNVCHFPHFDEHVFQSLWPALCRPKRSAEIDSEAPSLAHNFRTPLPNEIHCRKRKSPTGEFWRLIKENLKKQTFYFWLKESQPAFFDCNQSKRRALFARVRPTHLKRAWWAAWRSLPVFKVQIFKFKRQS